MSESMMSFELLRKLQEGATIEELAAGAGVSTIEMESFIREAARNMMNGGLDRYFPVDFDRLKPFHIDWSLLWWFA